MLKTKIMAFASLLLLLNTPALASYKGFYFKTITSLNKNCNMKTIDSDINFILNQKANLSPTLGLGIGYYVNPFFRTDLIFEHTNISFAGGSGDFRFSENGTLYFGTRSIKRRANVQSIMINGYVDIISKSSFKMFLGTGLGIGSSRIKESTSDRFDSNIIVNGNTIALPTVSKQSTNKNKNAFSYAFMVGADFNICRDFNLELAYSWKHSGKVKIEDKTNNVYQGHNISVLARFDI